MATASLDTRAKLSFAKASDPQFCIRGMTLVAASGGKENVALHVAKQPTVRSMQESSRPSKSMADSSITRVGRTRTGTVVNGGGGTKVVDGQVIRLEPQTTSQDAIAEVVLGKALQEDSVILDMSNLALKEHSGVSTSIDGGAGVNTASQHFLGGSSLEELQRIESPTVSSTKPPSLDGKSTTSGTTFALDEKESLRPDDSASVIAAEDDDTFSGRGSIVAGSRIGSEAAARAYRSQVYGAIDRRALPADSGIRELGADAPRSTSSDQELSSASQKATGGSVDEAEVFELFYKQGPDAKLLEALDSTTDRVFLLRLEQQVIQFVKNSKEPFMDLPPCNSFCRLLTHKLADYYHLTHTLEPAINSVRIFRTPFCRLPHSLTTYSTPTTSEHVLPSTVPTMKIMRRGDGNGAPSKATSEIGSDGKGKGRCAKEKQSREQREAEYKKARERIFGSTGDEAQDTDNSNEMSRSSSISIKDRNGQNKKKSKQRRDGDDGFESRATFTPFYGQPASAWTPTQQYMPMMGQQYNGSMQGVYPTPPSPYGQSMPSYGPPQGQWTGMQQMMPPPGPQGYGPMPPMYATPGMPYPPRNMPHSAYESTSPPQNQQFMGAWAQNPYQGPPSQHGSPAYQQTVPYAFGQLPNASDPADSKRQHPIPGSFVGSRHAFNPQTQSFVPGSANSSTPLATPHMTSPQASYQNYPQAPANGFYQFPNGGNMHYPNNGNMPYGPSGQSPSHSYQQFHSSPPAHAPQMMMPNMQHNMQTPMLPNGYHASSGNVSATVPQFGNAGLPQKPPAAV